MEKLTEFPALEDRRAYLEHALYTATQQANDAAAANKTELGVQQWLAGIRAELRELRYALTMLYRQGDTRIELSGRIVVFGVILLTAIILLQIAVLVWVNP